MKISHFLKRSIRKIVERILGMNKELELETVESAFFLEDRIASLENDYKRLRRNKPQAPPRPIEPELYEQAVDPLPYPKVKIKSKYKWSYFFIFGGSVVLLAIIAPFSIAYVFSTLLWVLGFFAGPVGALVYFIIRHKDKDKREKAVKNSPEYRQQCQAIDEQTRNRQIQLNKTLHEKYTQRYEQYKRSLPEYEEKVNYHKIVEIPEWSEELAFLGAALTDSKSALHELYDRNIIPFNYRNRSSLQWLAAFLSTSNYDLKTAIERFDTYVLQARQREQIDIAQAQLMVAQEQLNNQQYANWLHQQQVELTENGNSTLKSISNWQKADIAMREYRRYKAKRAAKKQYR